MRKKIIRCLTATASCHDRTVTDAERPQCVPTRSVGTRELFSQHNQGDKLMQKIQSLNSVRMDKTAFSTASLDDEPDEKQYWLSKTPVERIYCVEMMRQMLYGYDPLTARLQRSFETAEHP